MKQHAEFRKGNTDTGRSTHNMLNDTQDVLLVLLTLACSGIYGGPEPHLEAG